MLGCRGTVVDQNRLSESRIQAFFQSKVADLRLTLLLVIRIAAKRDSSLGSE